jgi:endonuclease-3
MKLSKNSNDWAEKLAPILKKYENKKHPLDYHNLYELLVMVILSTRDTDAKINKIAPGLFEVYPNMESLSVSNVETLILQISKVRNFGTKAHC